ncbi:M14 family metallopeptidase [Colwelliaceae bacterium BS250]
MQYKQIKTTLLLSSLLLTGYCSADDSILPPIQPWHGKSIELIVDDTNEWQTPAENMQLNDTPNYADTMVYLDKLVSSDKRLHMLSIGKSAQQRDINLVIASKEAATSPQALTANGKPTLFIQAGIHSGEIDGKDAGLMLLRDITKGNKSALLDKVNIIFLPILNVDGHERSSPFNRVNQRGPKHMGWRTTSQNLNLNRDYAKADTPEMQALMSAINTWQPSLYLDIHVTDGEDYQYDITYGFNGEYADSPHISGWLEKNFTTHINNDLSANGHQGNPLVFGMDSMDFAKGLYGWTASPRFSNGWGDVRNLPTVLVENHSLKPYKQRVLGTYVFIESTINLLAKQGDELISATNKDKALRPNKMTLAWDVDNESPTTADFAGINYTVENDTLTGIKFVNWTGDKKTYQDLPTFWANKAKVIVDVPKAYYLPPQFITVKNRLAIQGIQYQVLSKPVSINATQLTARDAVFNTVPFEGHLTVNAQFDTIKVSKKIPAGWLKVTTDQDLGKLTVALLDPRAPDSYFNWGFFNQMFQRTEYIESYAIVPLAHKLLKDKKLKAEFDKQFAIVEQTQKADSAAMTENSLGDIFKTNSDDKMRWLYQHSDFYDKQYLQYPVLLEY